MKKLLVTGAIGFIGSAFCRLLLSENVAKIIAVDSMSYAASPETLDNLLTHKDFSFHRANICDADAMHRICNESQPDYIVHFAAESHVDRSIDNARDFIETNIVGTFVMLDTALKYWSNKKSVEKDTFRFLHISTDEVYGSLGDEGVFTENTPYAPNSPYAASKAAADHLARAWHQTYGLPVLISNCSNNYGPYQFPEKLIPNMITKALSGDALPIYGAGTNVRDWLYVDDHAEALWTILTRGEVGSKYLIGGDGEKTNLELVKELCRLLDDRMPLGPNRSYESLITFVKDRPGHDKRYAMDYSKLKRELGWEPRIMLPEGLAKTVDWYLHNKNWWQNILAGSYSGERLGQIKLASNQS